MPKKSYTYRYVGGLDGVRLVHDGQEYVCARGEVVDLPSELNHPEFEKVN